MGTNGQCRAHGLSYPPRHDSSSPQALFEGCWARVGCMNSPGAGGESSGAVGGQQPAPLGGRAHPQHQLV